MSIITNTSAMARVTVNGQLVALFMTTSKTATK